MPINEKNSRNGSETLITATTSETSSSIFKVTTPVTIFCDTLAGVEVVDIKIERPDGNFVSLVNDGISVQLTVENKIDTLLAKGLYRVTKSTTAGSVGVYIYRPEFE